MAKHGENHVITGNAVILWDGITKPENNDSGQLVHNLKVALLSNDPTVAELNELAIAALRADSKFKGNLPPGGVWPLQGVDPNQYEGKLPAHVAFNAKTYRGAPQVFDANGQELSPMVYSNMLYPGAIVRALVHCYSFDNKSKGVAMGLDGIQIVDAQAPRLPVGGVDAGAAFGAAGKPPGVTAPPAYGPPGAAAPPAAAPPAYGPSGAGAPPAYGPPAGVAPAPDFLNPPGGAPAAPPAAPAGPVMTAKAAGTTYEAFRTAGWTDEQLRAQGYMQ